MYGSMQCLTSSGIICLCAETVESMSSWLGVYGSCVWYSYCLYGMLEFKLCCEMLNVVDMDQWKTVERAMLSTLFI